MGCWVWEGIREGGEGGMGCVVGSKGGAWRPGSESFGMAMVDVEGIIRAREGEVTSLSA